jgi:hypothetical protein
MSAKTLLFESLPARDPRRTREYATGCRPVREARIADIELLLVRREAKAVRLRGVIDDHLDVTGFRIHPVDIVIFLPGLGLDALGYARPASPASREKIFRGGHLVVTLVCYTNPNAGILIAASSPSIMIGRARSGARIAAMRPRLRAGSWCPPCETAPGNKFFAAVTLWSPWCATQIPTLEFLSQRRLLQSRSAGRASGAGTAAAVLMGPRAPPALTGGKAVTRHRSDQTYRVHGGQRQLIQRSKLVRLFRPLPALQQNPRDHPHPIFAARPMSGRRR